MVSGLADACPPDVGRCDRALQQSRPSPHTEPARRVVICAMRAALAVSIYVCPYTLSFSGGWRRTSYSRLADKEICLSNDTGKQCRPLFRRASIRIEILKGRPPPYVGASRLSKLPRLRRRRRGVVPTAYRRITHGPEKYVAKMR